MHEKLPQPLQGQSRPGCDSQHGEAVGAAGAGTGAGLCPEQLLCPSTAPAVTQPRGATTALSFAGREQWGRAERARGQGQLPSAPDWAGARPGGPAVQEHGESRLSPCPRCAPRAVLGPRLDRAGLSTMSWSSSPSFSSSSAMMSRAPPLPYPALGCGLRLDPHSKPCPCPGLQLGITLLPSSLTGFAGASSGSLGRAARAIGFAAVPLACPPQIFLLLFQETLLGWDPCEGLGLPPPTAGGASNKTGVLWQCPHPWEPHSEAQKNVLGFKDFFLFFFFLLKKKKKPLNSMASRKHRRN